MKHGNINVIGLVASVAVICLAPSLISLLGWDRLFDASNHPRGGYIHSVLEWTAFCTSIFIVILALLHYRIRHDPAIAVIGLAIFWAGCMDAAHILGSDGLFVAPHADLAPFTWAAARTFSATALLAGAACLIAWRSRVKVPLGYVIAVGLILGCAGSGVVYYIATAPQLPQTIYPENWIVRPWDAGALVLFAIGGLIVFPWLHRQRTDVFSLALWLSAAPQVAAQLHMTLGAAALYDHHFNIGHTLKIVAYLVPFVGLASEYIGTYCALSIESERRALTTAQLERANVLLTQRTAEMEQFAYTVSHDLKSPLVTILGFSTHVTGAIERGESNLALKHMDRITRAARRMSELIDDLLELGRVGRVRSRLEAVPLEELITSAVESCRQRFPNSVMEIAVQSNLPTITAYRGRLQQVFENLLSNAVKYGSANPNPRVEVRAWHGNGSLQVTVSDNGQGIAAEHHSRVFELFQRLEKDTAGTGIGLAIVKRIVELHEGTISVASAEGEGATFRITLPGAVVVSSDLESESTNGVQLNPLPAG